MPDSEVESHIDDPRGRRDRPPLLVKITGYRILTTVVLLVCGIWKAVASFQGEAVLSTSLDLVGGVLLALMLYWLGVFETSDPPCLSWFYHVDYAHTLVLLWTQCPSTSMGPLRSPVWANQAHQVRYGVTSGHQGGSRGGGGDDDLLSARNYPDALLHSGEQQYIAPHISAIQPSNARINQPHSELLSSPIDITDASTVEAMLEPPPTVSSIEFEVSTICSKFPSLTAMYPMETQTCVVEQSTTAELGQEDVPQLASGRTPQPFSSEENNQVDCPPYLIVLPYVPYVAPAKRGVTLRVPIHFSVDGVPGVPLVLNGTRHLDGARDPVFEGAGTKISYRLMFNGYTHISIQKYAFHRANRVSKSCTRIQALGHVEDIMRSFISSVACEAHHSSSDAVRFGPGGVELKDLYLLEITQVGRNTFQPIFAIKKEEDHTQTIERRHDVGAHRSGIS